MNKSGNMDSKLTAFTKLLEQEQERKLMSDFPGWHRSFSDCKVSIKYGKKYIKVDVGTSGKYMVDEEGNIFGIKGYGVIHRGHQYGNLDTINRYYWGGYTATLKDI